MNSIERRIYEELRRSVIAQAKDSPEDWKEYRRNKKAGFSLLGPRGRMGRVYLTIVVCAALIANSKFRTVDFRFAIFTLYASAMVFFRAIGLNGALYSSPERIISTYYPISDRECFSTALREWLVSLLPFTFYSFTVHWINFTSDRFTWQAALFSLFAGILQVSILAFLVFCILNWSTTLNPNIGLIPILGAVGALFWPSVLGKAAEKLALFLPAGWGIAFSLKILKQGNLSLILLPVVTTVIGLGTFVLAKKLAKTYPRTNLSWVLESIQSQDPTNNPEAQFLEDDENLSNDTVTPSSEPSTSSELLSRAHETLRLPLISWSTAEWATKLSAVFLTERERTVAEFLSGGGLSNWKIRWTTSLVLASGAVLAALLPMFHNPGVSIFILIAATLAGFPLLSSDWQAFSKSYSGGQWLQPVSWYPVGFGEVFWTIVKIDLARALLFLPIALISGAVVAGQNEYSYLEGAGWAFLTWMYLVAALPYAHCFRFSSGTDDTRKTNRTTIAMFAMILLNVPILITSVFLAPAVGKNHWGWEIGMAIAFAASALTVSGYYGLYTRGKIDLLSLPN